MAEEKWWVLREFRPCNVTSLTLHFMVSLIFRTCTIGHLYLKLPKGVKFSVLFLGNELQHLFVDYVVHFIVLLLLLAKLATLESYSLIMADNIIS